MISPIFRAIFFALFKIELFFFREKARSRQIWRESEPRWNLFWNSTTAAADEKQKQVWFNIHLRQIRPIEMAAKNEAWHRWHFRASSFQIKALSYINRMFQVILYTITLQLSFGILTGDTCCTLGQWSARQFVLFATTLACEDETSHSLLTWPHSKAVTWLTASAPDLF